MCAQPRSNPIRLPRPEELAAVEDWLVKRYRRLREFTNQLCEPLAVEDYVIQSMPDISPTKWHLAHTTWFFETLVLVPALSDYQRFHPQYAYLFNSYYNAVGPQFTRAERGVLSRPTVDEVYAYRRHVDAHMERVFERGPLPGNLADVITIGLHHEQQHQELLLTDIKHVFACNPLLPVYRDTDVVDRKAPPVRWLPHNGGVVEIGHAGSGFAYDNETPRHRVYLEPFELASRPVTNGDYLRFIADGGYERPKFWLSDGWATVQAQDWQLPLYWKNDQASCRIMTLSGPRDLDANEPVCHLSYYEADAYARWAGARLPTEAEWEVFAAEQPIGGNLLEAGRFHPAPADSLDQPHPRQMFGDVWEWTASPYTAYPGYEPLEGALGEYNGKFMCNQMVLRGGSCATPASHIRSTYRNFFPPAARWQFTGLRLARDL